jgi:hypothetical protein
MWTFYALRLHIFVLRGRNCLQREQHQFYSWTIKDDWYWISSRTTKFQLYPSGETKIELLKDTINHHGRTSNRAEDEVIRRRK